LSAGPGAGRGGTETRGHGESESSRPAAASRRRWLPTILLFAFICGIIAVADSGHARWLFDAVDRIPFGDKLGHFGLFGGLAFVLNLSLRCRTWRGWLVGSAMVATFCTVEEFTQICFESRQFDLVDLSADYVGIFVAGAVVKRISRRRGEV
jgi:hypothetical protein